LIEAGGIPGFGNELGARESGIGVNVRRGPGIGENIAGGIAGQDGSEIEAKTVNVHFLDPVAQAVHDHAAYNGIIRIEHVSRAAEIGVTGKVLLGERSRRRYQCRGSSASGPFRCFRRCG